MLMYQVPDKTFDKFIHHDLWEGPESHSAKPDIWYETSMCLVRAPWKSWGRRPRARTEVNML